MEQIKCAGSISRREANLGEAEEVGGVELVFVDFTSKNKFENFARRLLVAAFE